MSAFGNPFYSNQRLRAIQDSPQTQRLRDMSEARNQFQEAGTLIADFPSRKDYEQALYNRSQEIASARESAAQPPASSPLTQSPNLNFPITQGGERGMDRERINQTAMNEAMRLGGGRATDESVGRVIQTPYGVMSTSAPVGQEKFESSTAGFGGFDRPERYAMTPSGNFERQLSGADDRALAMAGMAEKGGDIRRSLEAQGQQRYAAFRQGSEERRAQEALSTEGRKPDVMRGAQALVQAERWKQAQQGRSPMSRTPLSAMGMEFRPTSMGQYAPVQRMGGPQQPKSPFAGASTPRTPAMGTAPQPMAGMPLGLSSPTGMGDISSAFRAFDDEQYQSPFFQFPFGGFGG